ncbi:MAG: hypothetical protein WA126_04840 [Thermodesulfovibrionales bacterium]
MNTFRFSYRGLSPHKLTPMPGVHNGIDLTRFKLTLVGKGLACAGHASR